VDHALGFGGAAGLNATSRGAALDLGSGGGLPGLVLGALTAPELRWTLLDARRRSVTFLTEAVTELGLEGRVTAVEGRAEEVGRNEEHRGRYGLVVARGFAEPAVTAECAAPLLSVGGRLVVSEPPVPSPSRWPAVSERLGLRLVGLRRLPSGAFAVLEQVAPCPSAYPRRTGVPAKRPLWASAPKPDVSRETGRGP
jgi:16S rRNA (guanine527-N7)-methyltransferase